MMMFGDMSKRQRTSSEALGQFNQMRLYIHSNSNMKDILQAYYHLHKNDTDIIEKASKINKNYTWKDVKILTDEKYSLNEKF